MRTGILVEFCFVLDSAVSREESWAGIVVKKTGYEEVVGLKTASVVHRKVRDGINGKLAQKYVELQAWSKSYYAQRKEKILVVQDGHL